MAAALVLAVWSDAAAKKGIVEDGVATQSLSGSSFMLTVEGIPFTDPNHTAGELAGAMFDRIRDAINAHPAYCAVSYTDPTDPNRLGISILRDTMADPNCQDGTPVSSLAWFEDDPNVTGAVVEFLTDWGQRFVLHKADAVAGNGTVTVEVTLAAGGLKSHTVTTDRKTAAQVNDEIRQALEGDGLTVTDQGTTFNVTTAVDAIRRVSWKHTDTGVNVSGIYLESSPATLPPHSECTDCARGAVPALTESGLVVLVLLTALAGALVLAGRSGSGPG